MGNTLFYLGLHCSLLVAAPLVNSASDRSICPASTVDFFLLCLVLIIVLVLFLWTQRFVSAVLSNFYLPKGDFKSQTSLLKTLNFTPPAAVISISHCKKDVWMSFGGVMSHGVLDSSPVLHKPWRDTCFNLYLSREGVSEYKLILLSVLSWVSFTHPNIPPWGKKLKSALFSLSRCPWASCWMCGLCVSSSSGWLRQDVHSEEEEEEIHSSDEEDNSSTSSKEHLDEADRQVMWGGVHDSCQLTINSSSHQRRVILKVECFPVAGG